MPEQTKREVPKHHPFAEVQQQEWVLLQANGFTEALGELLMPLEDQGTPDTDFKKALMPAVRF